MCTDAQVYVQRLGNKACASKLNIYFCSMKTWGNHFNCGGGMAGRKRTMSMT